MININKISEYYVKAGKDLLITKKDEADLYNKSQAYDADNNEQISLQEYLNFLGEKTKASAGARKDFCWVSLQQEGVLEEDTSVTFGAMYGSGLQVDIPKGAKILRSNLRYEGKNLGKPFSEWMVFRLPEGKEIKLAEGLFITNYPYVHNGEIVYGVRRLPDHLKNNKSLMNEIYDNPDFKTYIKKRYDGSTYESWKDIKVKGNLEQAEKKVRGLDITQADKDAIIKTFGRRQNGVWIEGPMIEAKLSRDFTFNGKTFTKGSPVMIRSKDGKIVSISNGQFAIDLGSFIK